MQYDSWIGKIVNRFLEYSTVHIMSVLFGHVGLNENDIDYLRKFLNEEK